ncbi:MAG: hypothetical protein JF887_00460 [Candidatus Dormibacteraeota bacterium]|uniref:Uncharacterized protein n=1 Tax=Candidatus Amunia macphersoniae TaxID=3127014 RepID=A0A934KFU4_9BACT|nr:hypothetical protein [Candidatus Dormibacteraeota bacterium]
MATDRQDEGDPILAEGLRLLEEDPALAAQLDDFERRLDSGEVPRTALHTTAEVRRRLGLPPPEAAPATPEELV